MKSVPVLLLLALPAILLGQYAGPAILSRGEAPAAMAAPQIDFRPFVNMTVGYDTGLAGVAVNDRGQLATVGSAEAMLGWGVSGAHSWRHTKVGLDYHGGLTLYTQQNQFSNLDQSLMLGVTHYLSRHLVFTLHETAGLLTRNFGVVALPQTVPFDPSMAFVPVTDYFDNRTVYVTSQAALLIQKTARLSFNLGGGNFIVDRRSQALYGSRGTMASGDVQYRITRRSTLGARYEFLHFTYPGIYGSTDTHGVAGTYGIRINRAWEFSGYAGILRVESTYIQSEPVDPVIAALLGISGAPEIFHRINMVPDLAGRLSRAYRPGVFYLAAGHSIIPGNGLFLTSVATQATVGYSYTGLRNWSFGAAAAYDRASAQGTITGRYADDSGTLTMSRLIARHISFILTASLRRYSSPTFVNYNRTIEQATVGLGYSPGDIPIRIW